MRRKWSLALFFLWKNRGLSGFVLFIALTLGSAREAAAANCISAATGNWTAITWTNCTGNPGGDPIATDTVTIANGHTVTLNTTTTIAGLTITGTSTNTTLVHGTTNGLTINGTVTINQPTSNTRSSLWNIAAGSGTVSGLITLAGTNTTASRDSDLTISTGTLDANGGITCAGTTAATKDITISSTGSINMQGTLTNTGCTFAPGTAGIFNYNGSAAQTVDLTWGAGNYYHLHLNNTSASGVTIPAAITATNVGGNLRVQSGLFTNGGFAITGGAGDTFEVANGATFNMSGTAAFPTGFTTFTFGSTSTVRYRQTNAQTVSAQTYGNLEISPAANTITHTFAAGTTTVAGNLTVGNGVNTGVVVTAATNSTTLDVNGSVTISVNTTLTAHATNPFTVAGDWTNNGAFTASGGTVTLDGGAAQAIQGTASTTFNNLTIANTSGGASLGASATVSGTLTLTSGAFAVGANTLTLNGPTIAGTPANLSTTSSSSLTFGGSSSAVSIPSSVAQLNNLTINNANGITLSSGPTVNGTLTFTSGNLNTTPANTLTIAAAGSISGATTSRHVVGNLARAFSAVTSFTYAIGDGTNYTPLAVTFGAAVTGNLTASVTNTDHPNTTAVTSGIDASKSINRYWTLKNSTISGTYSAALTYIDGTPVDRDSGATAASFVIRRGTSCSGSGGGRTCTSWGLLTSSGASNTLATATGVSISSSDPESDFVVGEAADTRFSREKEFIYTRELY